VWKDGIPQPTIRNGPGPVTVIRAINPASGSALLIRTPINKDLTLVVNPTERDFIDAGGGRVAVTSIFGEFTSGQKLRAFQSIHDYTAVDVGSFSAQPEVVLYAGECEIIPPEP